MCLARLKGMTRPRKGIPTERFGKWKEMLPRDNSNRSLQLKVFYSDGDLGRVQNFEK